ncbi:formate C-acetyltransferase [Prevotella aff. ruminicola Tc2-24]|uniref:Formate C-acetyltransferase n=1 Tax=Prevotella aff. ruminicola Tc2-24 TaxID=81582 RepID=A0A1I0P7M6_9BACT|nr:trans-4-hydroxy-L-proline dehydratase [Prevotella aff. ruminicola Tc2-24]SEW10349.1 formate C-acetyltransferase [Prevotella aff. ruminicola Tc2-24]
MINNNLRYPENDGGMNERIRRLRRLSLDTPTTLSIERALIETAFYEEHYGTMPIAVLRARNFYEICKKKTLYIGDDELIVGERGPLPKAVSTFPELTCHSVADLHTLNERPLQPYSISQADIDTYERVVIPYWKGKTQRERIFGHVSKAWEEAYHAGVFTEFMEQRAAGHTAMDGKMYREGLLDVKARIERRIASLDYIHDPEATDKQQELEAMAISCDAAILFAERHAELAEQMAAKESDPRRKNELEKIADVCRWVPAHAPRDLWEAIQMYWFVHLGTVTELNGWDSMNPGHIDQHLFPFYQKGIREGTLTRDQAKELISCLWIKFNNQPAPPKVGVTALESGTYNDFTNINIGGVDRDGKSGANELSYMILEVQEELHELQPGLSIHIAENTPDEFLLAGIKVIRQGHGYPSVFNPDTYVKEMVRAGKTLEDAREGGCSGCIEVGAFGKEAYLLTGYLNTPKILEITLNNGVDPETGKKLGLETGDPRLFSSFDELYEAWHRQMVYFVNLKLSVNNYIERMFSLYAPATFLSLYIDDCIEKGKDYYSGGARYNTTYIQCTGLGTITDCLTALKKHVFEDHRYSMDEILRACAVNWKGEEKMRQYIRNHTPFFGNDDDTADKVAVRVYDDLVDAIEGRPNTRGGKTQLNMLSTTCHNYFGSVCGATPNGRFAHFAISDGTSPAHGSDSHGPTAVIKSLGKLDQTKSGGTLLNMRFVPALLRREEDQKKLASLIRTYFKFGGHHIQFNIVDTATLHDAQQHPDEYRDLLVRVAGYSDYFNDMTEQLQNEIIARTENDEM